MSNQTISILSFLLSSLAIVLPIMLVLMGCVIAGEWKLLEKAGEPGWKAFIPIYNLYILFKLCWSENIFWIVVGAAVLFAIVPEISGLLLSVVWIMLSIRLVAAYGKTGGYAFGIIFLTPIFFLILGMGDSSYIGPSTFSNPAPARVIQYKEPRAEAPAHHHSYPELSVQLKNKQTGATKVKTVNGSRIIVGRDDSKAQLVIHSDKAISREHLELEFKNEALYARDLNSTYGTKLNGRAIKGSVRLKQHDVLTIGRSNYSIQWRMKLG